MQHSFAIWFGGGKNNSQLENNEKENNKSQFHQKMNVLQVSYPKYSRTKMAKLILIFQSKNSLSSVRRHFVCFSFTLGGMWGKVESNWERERERKRIMLVKIVCLCQLV